MASITRLPRLCGVQICRCCTIMTLQQIYFEITAIACSRKHYCNVTYDFQSLVQTVFAFFCFFLGDIVALNYLNMILRFSIQVKVHVENVLLSKTLYAVCTCERACVCVCVCASMSVCRCVFLYLVHL